MSDHDFALILNLILTSLTLESEITEIIRINEGVGKLKETWLSGVGWVKEVIGRKYPKQ